MLTLYAVPASLYCAKLRIVLRAKRLAWEELPPPGGYGSDAYRALVPSGNLPALRDGALLLADSEAIAEYLEETRPDPPLLPPDPALRARMRERGRFHDTRLEPAVRRLFAHVAPGARDASAVAAAAQEIGARLAQFDRMLREAPQLDFGLGDCGWPVTMAWLDRLEPVLNLDTRLPSAVAAYRDGLARVPAVAEELAAYGPVVSGWIAAKAAP